MAKVYGTNGSDVLNYFMGGVTHGDDTIFGYGGEDWISGDLGNDVLQGGAGPDHLYGDAGNDTANYADSGEGVYVNLATGVALHGTAEGDSFNSIENLFGSLFNDVLVGDNQANVLSGCWGDDTLVGHAGADVLDGSGGIDTANYLDSPASVMVSLLWHSASGGDAEGDELKSIENLRGSNYNDSLFGDNGANVLSGCGGADVILGFGGPDTLVGDTRNVPFGNDTLNGGDGNDILNGGKGGDSLTGGAGADTFVWNSAEESAGVSIPLGGIDVANTDVILDFNRAEGDVIDLQNVDANDPLPGFQQGFNFIGEYWAHGGFTAPGQVAYALDGTGNTYLFFNTNYVYTTSDIADFEFGIRLVGQYTPNADWLNYGLGFQ